MPTEPAPGSHAATVLKCLRNAEMQGWLADTMQIEATLKDEHNRTTGHSVRNAITQLRRLGHRIERVLCYTVVEPYKPPKGVE